jgi:arylsulfatase A-like enzyme
MPLQPHSRRLRPRRLLVTAYVVLQAAAFAASPARPPNVLLIVSDDQRPDTIRALGNPSIHTPNLDRLVRDGASFTRAIAANPHCTPSRAEIMTGATGFRNGSQPFGRAIRPEMVLWANTMRQAGYHAWYTGKWMNDGTPRTRGYEETLALFSSGGASRTELTHPVAHNGRPVTGYTGWTFKTNDGTPELDKGVGLTPTSDRHIADGAIAFIERRPARPFFLHVNFTAPHDPLLLPPGYETKYDPVAMPLPANFLAGHPFDHGNAGQRDEQLLPLPRTPAAVRAEIAAYYAVISYMDEQIGRILQALQSTGQDRNTVVIFTSDHGLALGSHGLMGKQNMYEHTIGVPLILAGPGIPPNRRFAAQAYLYDLYPTVCDLAGIPIPKTVEGRSLVPILSGRVREIHPEVYAYWHRAGLDAPVPIQRMVRTERWKLIYYSHLDRWQLFDLQADPHELSDLSSRPEHRQTVTELRRKLDQWFTARMKGVETGPAQPGS